MSASPARRGAARRLEAVVADLDGTLVGAGFGVSRATIMALKSLRAAGIAFIVATARTPEGLERVAELAALSEIAVCCSGAIGYSRKARRVLWRETLSRETVEEVVALARAYGAGAASFDGTTWWTTPRYEELSGDLPRRNEQVTAELSELLSQPSCAMALRDGEEILELAARELSMRAHTALSYVGDRLVLDVAPLGVDKGFGARRAFELLGIDADATVSFGDMPNDLPLFSVSGRSYAVGAPHPLVVAAAYEVVAAVEDDGFAQKVRELEADGFFID